MIIDTARELRLKKFKRELRTKSLDELEKMLPEMEKLLNDKLKIINAPAYIEEGKNGVVLTYILTKHKLEAVKREIEIRKENNFETKKQLKIEQRFSNKDEEVFCK